MLIVDAGPLYAVAATEDKWHRECVELVVEPIPDSDWDRIAELMQQYLDLPLGLVDASVVATAERHGVETIATLDRRHFGTVRPRHVAGFTLVP